jgi:hypothetical protein
MVERTLEARDDRPHRGVVVAQEGHDLFRLDALGKPGKAAQVAEHDDDLAAMAFEDALIALRDDQVGELRREVRARNSPRRRAFSIAMTACAAKFCNSVISLSENGRTSRR